MDTVETDILVIGTGIAGLTFALRASRYADVVMATKKEQSASNTNYAQGGIASVLAPTDSLDQHVEDTLRAGAGLCREAVVRHIVEEGPAAVRNLVAWGVTFTPGADDRIPFDLGLEGGHSHPRVVHAGDFTGRQIESALLARAEASKRIRILEHHIALRLLVGSRSGSGEARCFGADVISRDGRHALRIRSRAVLLATGGAGRVYQHTTNPSIATGDGIALAFRAGAAVSNLEFMQFHPTSLYRPGAHPFLISEAVRGEGGQLRNGEGRRFMPDYDPAGELAPRDVVARAIDQEMKMSGAPYVRLDVTSLPKERLRKRFPNIYRRLKQLGIDMAAEEIPVVPAAHYLCGGVPCDLEGRTEIEGLLVSGEVACSGMHGANRLASNSLLEAVVLSQNAARHLERQLPDPGEPPDLEPVRLDGRRPQGVEVAHIRRDIAQTMWDFVGIVRSDERLRTAERHLARLRGDVEQVLADSAPTYHLAELANVLQAAELMVACARRRRESRGLHYNTDAPPAAPGEPATDTVLRPTEDYVTA